MDHSITTEGYGVRLRPVRMDDAGFIVWLRSQEHARGRIGDTGDETAQRAWLEKYFAADGDYYFIIETAGGKPVGTYGIYDIHGRSAESGRWVIRPEVWAGYPSLMLAFRTAFEMLDLDELRISMVSTNRPMISLYTDLGARRTGLRANAQRIEGKPVDLVYFEVAAGEWPQVRDYLAPLAKLAEEQVSGWDRTPN